MSVLKVLSAKIDMESGFKRFFTYVLNEYCEETCTAQDELFDLIAGENDAEVLSELFIDEGFLKWLPSEFICLHSNIDDAVDEGRYLDQDEMCAEKYWESICENINESLDDILEYL